MQELRIQVYKFLSKLFSQSANRKLGTRLDSFGQGKKEAIFCGNQPLFGNLHHFLRFVFYVAANSFQDIQSRLESGFVHIEFDRRINI